MRQKIHITVLETGHILEGSLASGDEWLENIAHHLPPQKYFFQILLPTIGAQHWQRSGLDVKYLLLPSTPLDNNVNPFAIFLAYCLRVWYTLRKLKKLGSLKIIYSSTDVLPDVLPAYFFKKSRPNTLWIAKVHHLYSSPFARPGNLLVNTVSYLMQRVSLFCLKNTCDFIIVNNSQLYSELERLGFKRKRMKVLGAGVNYTQIVKQKVLPKTKTYQGVYLGRIHQTKGIFDLIPIWAEVIKSSPRARLAVIGKGTPEIEGKLLMQIRQNGLERQIELLGFLDEQKIYSILKKARVFLFTDREAGWGQAVAEAMTCGCPVVGYDIGILGDVFKEGFRVVKLGDTQKFAQEIIQLLKNGGERERFARHALDQAKDFDWEKTSKKFVSLLKPFTISWQK